MATPNDYHEAHRATVEVAKQLDGCPDNTARVQWVIAANEAAYRGEPIPPPPGLEGAVIVAQTPRPAATLLSPRELAAKHGVPYDALRKRLERWRIGNDTGWKEIADPKPNEPQFLYEESAVMAVIAEQKSSSERPAQKI